MDVVKEKQTRWKVRMEEMIGKASVRRRSDRKETQRKTKGSDGVTILSSNYYNNTLDFDYRQNISILDAYTCTVKDCTSGYILQRRQCHLNDDDDHDLFNYSLL